MPQSKKANDKVPTTTIKKIKNIQLIMDTYKNPISDFLLRAAASLNHYLKNSIFNYFNNTPKYEYISDIYVEQQKFSLAEEIAFINYIFNCYKSVLFLNVELLHYYVNKLCRLKEDHEPIEKKLIF
jgi:hypothetical protein